MGIKKSNEKQARPALAKKASHPPHRMGPLIISSSMYRRGMTGEYKNKLQCYSLWGLESGELTLWDREGVAWSHAAPICLFLSPEGCSRVACPAASEVMSIQFDIIERPFLRDIYGTSPWPLGERVRQVQPEPEAIWGVSMPRVLPARMHGETMAVIRDCCATAWRGRLHYLRANMRLGLWLADLALEVCRGMEGRPPSMTGDGLDGGEAEWAWRLVERARRQLDVGVGVAEMAVWARMSPRHFSLRFERAWGMKPGRFLVEARMQLASRLLRSGTLTVAQVARECGYKSPKTFSLQFRAHFGTSPSGYRRAYPT